MLLSEAKIRIQSGDVSQAFIQQDSEDLSFYNLYLDYFSDKRGHCLFTQRGQVRKFRTIDSAVSLVRELGLHRVTVVV